MNQDDFVLLKSLIYLDTAFIADYYELTSGISSSTTITRAEGKQAGASLPIFSANISAQESRTFSVSSFEMLKKMIGSLEKEPSLDPAEFSAGMQSRYGWIDGCTLSTMQASRTKTVNGSSEELAKSAHFILKRSDSQNLLMITTPEYFTSGVQVFIKLQETVLKRLRVPVKAYVRAVAASGHNDQWIVIPLVILETAG